MGQHDKHTNIAAYVMLSITSVFILLGVNACTHIWSAGDIYINEIINEPKILNAEIEVEVDTDILEKNE